jgi:hypothetical protein
MLEITRINIRNSDFGPSAGLPSFAPENDLKALALCAARSHIVAVR